MWTQDLGTASLKGEKSATRQKLNQKDEVKSGRYTWILAGDGGEEM